MALYNDDFSSDTPGAAPSGWTERWDATNSDWVVQAGSGEAGGQFLRHTASASSRRLLSWDAIDSDAGRADTEILVRLRTSTYISSQNRLYLRAAGSAGAESGYFVELNYGSSFKLYKYLNGASSTLESYSIDWQQDTWYWIRFQAQGTSLKAKIWTDAEFEPASWNIATTDSDIIAAGWTGIGANYYYRERDFDYVAVGTDGESPSLPDAGPTRLTQAALEIASSPTPALRASQLVVEQVRQPHPPVRLTQAVAEVVIATTPPGLHYYQQALEVVVKRVAVLQVHQRVLEMVVKKPQHAISSGQPRRGSVAT